jgi:hypothetical protein
VLVLIIRKRSTSSSSLNPQEVTIKKAWHTPLLIITGHYSSEHLYLYNGDDCKYSKFNSQLLIMSELFKIRFWGWGSLI